ncbi:MAG TPA: nuclear transport factor 2 family protein [Acidisarcina sp.]|nr:nuclear transport factor 2 family protein [Acidisarcina sp.]
MRARAFLFDALFRAGLPSDTCMRFSPPSRLTPQETACILVFVTLFLLSAIPSRGGVLPHRSDKHEQHKEIETVESQWRQAMLNNNVGDMDKLLADDYIAITANGTIETKAQVLASRKAGTMRITRMDMSDTKVRIYGDTAVVTSRAEINGSNGASDISGHYRYTRVYNYRLGKWKIVSFEASRMRDPNALQKR